MSPDPSASLRQEGAPRRRKIKTERVVDGHPVVEEIWVDVEEGARWRPREEQRILGHRIPRVDGPIKVNGAAVYAADVRLPGMLWGRVLCSPVPKAKVRIDLAPALAIEGVEAAVVLRDSAGWLGQPLAAVAARTRELAEDGLRAIRLEIEEEPWVLTREQALAQDAPQVTRRGNVRPARERGERDEVEQALAGAAAVVDALYVCPVQHHVCLETHGVVVDYRGGEEATVHASTQATFAIPGEAAEVLGLPSSAVRSLVPVMGGGFGSKFGLDHAGRIACMLSKQTGRPVHLLLDRRAEFLSAGNRSGARQRLRAGVDQRGRLIAMASEVEQYGGLGRGSNAGHPYIYSVPKVFASHVSVHTHTDGSRAMRAPGHPQASFATESILDELAYRIGMDPLELRLANLPEDGRAAYERQLRRCAREIGWYDHPHRTAPGAADGEEAVGIGFGLSTWGGGGRPACEVRVSVTRDGRVTSEVGSQDLGTGTRTYVAAIPAEELGLSVEAVEARIGDSRLGAANGSGGSVTTASLAPAVKDAAWKLRQAFAEHLGRVLDVDPARLSFEGGRIVDRGDPARVLSWREACATLPPQGLAAQGTWKAELADRGVHGAQAARVRVDLRTGRVAVEKMVCVQNCGRPMNRMAIESQIRGGMLGALSYALFEERVLDPVLGMQLNANLEDYKIAGALECPELVAIVDDEDRREGVIGLGEPPAIPGAGAIANAVHNACGARVRELPITPAKVLAALGRIA